MDFLRLSMEYLEPAILLALYLAVVFVVHELGHYAAARVLGMKVRSVVFGRGRLVASRKDRHGTTWCLHLFPLRAHVQIDGFEDRSVSLPRRMMIVLAGPLANLLLPFVFFACFYLHAGKPVEPTAITLVEMGSPADIAGLRPGDTILSIDGHDIRSGDEIRPFTAARRTAPLAIRYDRAGATRQVLVRPDWKTYRDRGGFEQARGQIGISTNQRGYDLSHVRAVRGVEIRNIAEAKDALRPYLGRNVRVSLAFRDGKIGDTLIHLSTNSARHWDAPGHRGYHRLRTGADGDNMYLPLSLSESVRESAAQTGLMIRRVALMPFNLFPLDMDWIRPDVTVSKETSAPLSYLYAFVFFTALCSILIGLLNLVPLPGLDGGVMVLLIAEARAKRPLIQTERAAVLVIALLAFYAAVFGANTNDMRHYYAFQIQKAFADEK